MKKIFLFVTLAALILAPQIARAEINVQVGIPLPPAIVITTDLDLIPIPLTDAYAAPDVDVEIYFWGGWWWRPWQGRWYRSRHYNSGWAYYNRVPAFYPRVHPRWREAYRERRWDGREWNYRKVPRRDVERNWNKWEREKYWQRHNNWGVQPRPKPRPGYRDDDGRPGQPRGGSNYRDDDDRKGGPRDGKGARPKGDRDKKDRD